MSDNYSSQIRNIIKGSIGPDIGVGRQFLEDLANYLDKRECVKEEDFTEDRLKFIEAQFGIEFVPPHEVGPSYRKIQQDVHTDTKSDGGVQENNKGNVTEEEYFDEGSR